MRHACMVQNPHVVRFCVIAPLLHEGSSSGRLTALHSQGPHDLLHWGSIRPAKLHNKVDVKASATVLGLM